MVADLVLRDYEGKKRTRQEILLTQAYNSMQKMHYADSKHGDQQVVETNSANADRLRVQKFLAQRKSAVPTPSSIKQSGLDKVKTTLSGKLSTSKIGIAKTANPLADILGTNRSSKRQMETENSSSLLKRNRTTVHPSSSGGKEVFMTTSEGFLLTERWDSSQDENLIQTLENFSFKGKNTLVLSAMLPEGSPRGSVNICLSDSTSNPTVLYHFNPRRNPQPHIIQNSRFEGQWGVPEKMHNFPLTFGTLFTLRVAITFEALYIYIDDVFQAEYRHRARPEEDTTLILNVPVQDDSGNPEGFIIQNVWWGHSEIQVSAPETFPSHSRFEDRSPSKKRHDVYVGGLPMDADNEDVERIFQDFNCESIRVIQGKGFGFVTLRNSQDVDDAIQRLNGIDVDHYRIRVSRARDGGRSSSSYRNSRDS